MLKKSPNCTIGNSNRFDQGSSISRYKLNVPSAYCTNMVDKLAPKMKMGVIGNTRRFKQPKDTSPGPGNYNT